MPPLFTVSGFTLEPGCLRILQKEGWVAIALADVAGVKAPLAAEVVVRLADGRRQQLDLTHLSLAGFRTVKAALQAAVAARRGSSSSSSPHRASAAQADEA